MEDRQVRSSQWQWWLVFFVLVILFTLAYAQSPLFTSNQNQYFFNGLANSGYGDLDQDWLYSTNDIVPVFSWLVSLTYNLFHAMWVFYLWYVVIFAIYLYSLYGIAAHLFQWEKTIKTLALFGTAAVLLHSAALRYGFSSLISPDWEYLIEGGVAGQRVLGDVFQPSSFGVLFLLSIYLFLKEKPYWAVVVSSLAAIIHPTYLLSAAILTATYGVIRLYETKKLKELVFIGGLALVLVAPILYYTAGSFFGVDPALASQANEITVNYRQPHHMLIEQWLDLRAAVKAMLLVFAMILIRKQRLLWVLLPSVIAVVGLTALQAIIKNPTLAMLFPWRFSVILIPLSTMLLASKVLDAAFIRPKSQKISNRMLYALCGIILVVCAAAGTYKFFTAIHNQRTSAEYTMMEMVREQYQPGQVIVVPLKWQQFRLVTGIPIVVEFKAGPQSAPDIVEWYQRVQQVDHFYAGLPYGEGCLRLRYLQTTYGATHVVIPNDLSPELACMTPILSNEEFGFYEIVETSNP